MTPRRPVTWLAVVAVVLSIAVLVLLRGDAGPVRPVSNPGLGVESPRTTPPPRFDWTDE